MAALAQAARAAGRAALATAIAIATGATGALAQAVPPPSQPQLGVPGIVVPPAAPIRPGQDGDRQTRERDTGEGPVPGCPAQDKKLELIV